MPDEEDPKKPVKEGEESEGCDCSCCPGCGALEGEEKDK